MKREDTTDQPPAGAGGAASISEFLHSWRYFLWLLGLILIVVVVFVEENWRGERAWNEYRNQEAARGEPIGLSAIIPPKVPDDQNFAMTPFLAPLFGFSPGAGNSFVGSVGTHVTNYEGAARSINLPKSVRFSSWVRPRTDLPAWYAAFTLSKGKAGSKQAPRRYSPAAPGADAQSGASNSAQPAALRQGATNLNSQSGLGVVRTNVSTQEAAQGVLEMLSENDTILEELQAASKLPYCRFNLNYEKDDPYSILLPHLSAVKHLCQILELRACAELALDQTDRAFQDTQLALYLTDSFRAEPFLISQLVRRSCLSISLQPFAEGIQKWSEPQLQWFQQRFGEFDFCSDMARAFKAERTWNSITIDYIRNAPNKLDVLNNLGGQPSEFALGALLMSVAPNGWFDLEKLNCSRMVDQYLLPPLDPANRRVSPGQCRVAQNTLSNLANHSYPGLYLRHTAFSKMLLPGTTGPVQKAALAQTAADCAGIACALELYHRAQERYPEKLEELTPRFISKLPHDIITGEALRYHAKDGAYVLYSVGWNEIDEEGTVELGKSTDEDSIPRGDWVWRLPQ